MKPIPHGLLMYLLFQQAVYDLSAVAPEIGMHEGYVYPVGTRLWVLLPDELVEIEVLADVVEPPAAFLHVSVDAEVCSLSLQVLRVADTTHGLVQSLGAESAAYLDGFAHGLAQGFEHVDGQIDQIDHLVNVGLVVESSRLSCSRGV